MRFKQSIFLAIGCAAAIAAFAEDPATPAALSETPAAVQKTIQARVGDGKLGDIDKISENGGIVYEVGLTAKDGQDRDFTVAEDGTLSSAQVTLAETPAAVQKSIQTLAKTGAVERIDQSLDDPEITYDIGLTTKDGLEKGFTLDAEGVLLSMEVTLAEMPAAAQQTVQTEVADGTVKSISKMFDAGGITYDVEATAKGGREKAFTVAESGKVVSQRITVHETPPAVRRTIRARIAGGKILRIDRTLTEDTGGMAYEVQGRKDGKAFDFSVGPNGRFLGMDN